MSKKKVVLINRDLSWLSFNERVLQEAEDKSVPLLERIRFLGIFSSNRDEFFKVRVATILRMARWGKKGKELLGDDPVKLQEKIQRIVLKQQKKFDKLYFGLLKELEAEKIFILNEKQVSDEQGVFIRAYFKEHVFPLLVPIMIDMAPRFPYLKDNAIYLAVRIHLEASQKEYMSSLIEIPTESLSRFLVLPSEKDNRYIILLDDVIRYCLGDIYSSFTFDHIDAYTLKLMRDAELDIDQDISKSWMEKISKSVKQRKRGEPVRLAYDENMPDELLKFILKKIKMHREGLLIPGGRYHRFRDFISFPDVGRKELRNISQTPILHPDLKDAKSLFQIIRQKDILMHYPYQSFNHIIDLLREASIDPLVQSIRITLYRVASNSSIVNALINAVKNGKKVTVVVEIQARFDEESNITNANRLQEEGAEVIFGVPGLKVHSKLFLITRKEDKKFVHYAHVGTGNFNEQTARVYCDHSILTSNKKITDEVEKLFNFYRNNYKTGTYKQLIVSPFNTRKKFISFIHKEIEQARAGKEAWIFLKMNSLVDAEMIAKLYDASQAGVKIRLIVRGVCSLIAGKKGQSENIEAISIVDRYLEHSRIFVFCNSGEPKYYLSSGDWMYRNLDHRSEVAVPVLDPALQMQLNRYMQIQWDDNQKARILNELQDNKYKKSDSKLPVRAQVSIYRWLTNVSHQAANGVEINKNAGKKSTSGAGELSAHKS